MRHPVSGRSRGRSRSRATSTCGRSWSTPRRPATIETNAVTDPYSVALTTNSERSVAIDLDDKDWRPKAWEKTKAPVIDRPVDRAIYELHIRDFSITDETVPEAERGTYRAFTRDSAGTTQLRQLADAGHQHRAPAAVVRHRHDRGEPGRRRPCRTATSTSFGPAAPSSRRASTAVVDADGFNWGYDPYHYSAPEGSYAVDPEGGARVHEFREMVGALHGIGLQVVLDEVFNHTAQSGQGEQVGARPGRARLLPAPQPRGRRRDLDVLPERRDRARGRPEAHGRLGRHVGARLQGRRVPLRPDGPPLEGEHARDPRRARRAHR